MNTVVPDAVPDRQDRESEETPVRGSQGRPADAQEKQVPVSFGAYPSEVARWKAAAKADNRPLSQWLRLRLLEVDAREGNG